MTDEKRESSAISKAFSTVYELKKNDFFNIIKQFPNDYVRLPYFSIYKKTNLAKTLHDER